MVKIILIEKSLSDQILIQSRIPDYCTVITVQEYQRAVALLENNVIDVVIAGPSVSRSEFSCFAESIVKSGFPGNVIVLYKNSECMSRKPFFNYNFKVMQVPVELAELNVQIEKIVRSRLKLMTEHERHYLDHRMSDLVGSSEQMIKIKESIVKLGTAPGPVLITGESGTGKEIIARMLHDFSDKNQGPFHAINAGAIPSGLSSVELFGSAPGAYTGAVRREGCFEHAHGGSLFLDEITDVEPAVQAELLRVLESREVQKLGTNRSRGIDVRLISATNKNIGEEVLAGRFRKDLLYRIDMFRIDVPPLRERKNDIPDLLMHFSNQLHRERPNKHYVFSDQFIERLFDYDWPGNVRELRSVFRRAVYASDSETLNADSINFGF